MSKRSCLAIVLAAGAGTRMRSNLPKVLHKIGGLPLIGHVLTAVKEAGVEKSVVVIGPEMDALREFVAEFSPASDICIQMEQLGTADAVKAANSALTPEIDDVLILYGDTPLVTGESILEVRKELEQGSDLAVLGFDAENPQGYGRIIIKDGRVVAIREEAEVNDEERDLTICNSGIMGIRSGCLNELLTGVGNENAKGEFYLTELVEVGHAKGHKIGIRYGSESEVQGVNTRQQLAQCEAKFQERMRDRMLEEGVTLVAPQTVYFSFDTNLEPDVTVEQNVTFGPGVEIKSGTTIRAYSHLEGAVVSNNCIVGPFARLRPGTLVEQGSKIGNFVEVKNAMLAEGVKVNHLSYVGDAEVGRNANIGAGTITCNYDGIEKHRTEIGEDSFIGSNSALVAPVSVGKGAYVASGSVITVDVPDDSLGLGRTRQENKPGWVSRFWKRKRGGATSESGD